MATIIEYLSTPPASAIDVHPEYFGESIPSEIFISDEYGQIIPTEIDGVPLQFPLLEYHSEEPTALHIPTEIHCRRDVHLLNSVAENLTESYTEDPGLETRIDMPIFEYEITCYSMIAGSMEEMLCIRSNIPEKANPYVFLQLEHGGVAPDARRRESFGVRVIDNTTDRQREDVFDIGLKHVEKVIPKNNRSLKIVFKSAQVNTAAFEENASGGKSTRRAGTFDQIAGFAYDRIEICAIVNWDVKEHRWEDWCDLFPRQYLQNIARNVQCLKELDLNPTERFFYKWGQSRAVDSLLSRHQTDDITDSEYKELQSRLWDIKACVKAVATSHLVTVETVGKYLRDHYSAQAVQLLANLSNDSTPLPVDSEFKDGILASPNPAHSGGNNIRRRWLYGHILLSNHLACLDILIDARHTLEELKNLFESK